MPTKEQDTFIGGGILAVVGLVVLASARTFQDIVGAFLLLGLGIVFMASSSDELRERDFEFFFSIFEGLWKLLRRSE